MTQLNRDTIFKVVIFIFLCIFFAVNIINNKIISYIDPKILPFIICALALFLIISLFLITDIFTTENKELNIFNDLVFIISIVILFVPTTVDSNYLSFQNINNMIIENDTIVINSKNFVDSICEILNDSNKYDDMNIEITGFICQNNGNFIIANNISTRHLNDNKITGLICRDYDFSDFSKDTWLNVRGKLKFDTDISKMIILVNNVKLDLNPDTSSISIY